MGVLEGGEFVYATLAIVGVLAGFTQGFTGFGSTVVALPVLGWFMEMREAVPAGCLMALALNAVLVARLRGHAQGGALLLLLGVSLAGMAVGEVSLSRAPEPLLKCLLGLVILYACLGGVRAGFSARTAGRGWGVAAGLVAGAMGVSIGVNGPPIVAWAARQGWTREAFKATLTLYFLLSGLCIVVAQGAQGRIDGQTLKYAAATLPGMLLGLWIGNACCGKVQDRTFRLAVYGLLTAMGLSLLWQAGAGMA